MNVRHACKHQVFVGVQGQGILKECISSLIVGGDVQDAPAYVWVCYFEAVFVRVVRGELGKEFAGAVLDATSELLVVLRDGAGIVVVLDGEKVFVALRVLEPKHTVRIEKQFFPLGSGVAVCAGLGCLDDKFLSDVPRKRAGTFPKKNCP